jgi:hypothetical protein
VIGEEHIIREHLARQGFAEHPITCVRRDPGPVWLVLVWDRSGQRGIVYLRGTLAEVLHDIARFPAAQGAAGRGDVAVPADASPVIAHDEGPDYSGPLGSG